MRLPLELFPRLRLILIMARITTFSRVITAIVIWWPSAVIVLAVISWVRVPGLPVAPVVMQFGLSTHVVRKTSIVVTICTEIVIFSTILIIQSRLLLFIAGMLRIPIDRLSW